MNHWTTWPSGMTTNHNFSWLFGESKDDRHEATDSSDTAAS
ncbi:MAG TPA: hypothetical protein VK530_15310 [Candidatus Acidoferrum sp.]|nr:hypothetical protein [Candidatus Acidoferrum sp.]